MTDLAERLTLAMAGPPEVKPSELARACGIRQPSINDWLNGRTKKLEGANLLAAAEFLHVNPWWLATGAGPMRSPMPDSEIREAISLLQSLGQETRRVALTQIKALSHLSQEHLVTAESEKSGKIGHPNQTGSTRHTVGESGVNKTEEKQLDFGEAVRNVQRLAGIEGASLSTTKGKKRSQS